MLSFVLLCFLLTISNGSHLQDLQLLLNVSDVLLPKIDFSSSQNDALELLGGFQDFSFYRYTGQQNFTHPLNSTTNSRGLVYYSNNTFLQLASGSNDTNVARIVPIGEDSFILSGTGQIEGHNLEHQLLYNLTDLSFKPIFNSSLTEVNAILVDESLVYFGGNFSYSNGSKTGHSAAIWNSDKNSISLLPFLGFGSNSTVNSIIKLDADNVLFAGKFYELDAGFFLQNQIRGNSSQSINLTQVELGSAIPLQNANWTYGDSQFNSSRFICPNPNEESWLTSEASGSLSCTLPQDVTLNKIRIYNSPVENNGVSLFRIITNPSQGIMNLTYVDPDTGEEKYCDAFCPLYNRRRLELASSNSSSTKHMTTLAQNNTADIKWGTDFQEFAFVNNILISSIEFLALSSYGENVGLSSLQLFQNTPSIYANNSLNKPACSDANSYVSASLSNNHWKQGLIGQNYVSAVYIPGQGGVPQVTFYPHIQYPGEYLINIYTPGCLGDGTCSQRAVVNVTLWDGDTNALLSTALVYENNNELKYNEIYSGHLKSSPRITLEYYSSIYPSNPSSVIVADYINVITKSIDNFNEASKIITLNGLFQYQISNFTEYGTPVGNTSLNRFPITKFPSNSSLFVSLYGGNTLLLADSSTNVVDATLDNSWNITSTGEHGTGAKINGIASYSEGLVLFGDYNSSSKQSSALSFNGSFNPFQQIGKSVATFANITLQGSELLVFDNEFVYNVSSKDTVSNTSYFAFSIWSAGQNNVGDVIFSGVISANDYTSFDTPFDISGNGSVKTFNSEDNINPYMGIYLNETLSAYAFEDDIYSSLKFSDGKKSSWTWSSPIRSLVYLNNDTLLAVGTSSQFSSPQLTVLNLTTFEVVANETLDNGAEIRTMVFFEQISTLLVGGNFSIPGAYCDGLCLFNYASKRWSSFANGSISGNIEEVQLRYASELLISGSYQMKNTSNVNLASFNLSDETMELMLRDLEGSLKSLVLSGDKIIAWNDTNLISYGNESWTDISNWNTDASPKIISVEELSIDQSYSKRDESSHISNALLVYGNFYGEEQSTYQALLYDYENWKPFFMVNLENSNATAPSSIFMNEDVSSLYVSEESLLNSNVTHSSSSSNASSRTSSKSSSSKSSSSIASATAVAQSSEKGRHHQRVDRGYVVLIGLALAVGTVAVIGLLGLLVAFIFGEDIGGYELLNPPLDSSKTIDTTPPEKLP